MKKILFLMLLVLLYTGCNEDEKNAYKEYYSGEHKLLFIDHKVKEYKTRQVKSNGSYIVLMGTYQYSSEEVIKSYDKYKFYWKNYKDEYIRCVIDANKVKFKIIDDDMLPYVLFEMQPYDPYYTYIIDDYSIRQFKGVLLCIREKDINNISYEIDL